MKRQFGQVFMVNAEGQRVTASASGKTFSVITGARMHQASAPGESPAIDTGYLVNSIRTRQENQLTWVVYTNAEYARALEYGTYKIAPRPFFRPAADHVRPGFLAAVANAVRGAADQAAGGH